jgi:import inner membrane translocase subunit TIM10
MQAAQTNELEAMTDMFNKCAAPTRAPRPLRGMSLPRRMTRVPVLHRMTEQCFRKCVALYKEPELSVGEATCVDRCVHKYMTAHGKVQEILSKHAQAAQQR